MTADNTRAQIAGQLLAWYEAMGVDAAVEDSTIDWLARGARAPGDGFALPAAKIERAQSVPQAEPAPRARPTATPAQAPLAQAPRAPRQFVGTPPPAAGGGEGREALAATRALPDLEAILRRFEGCGLKATAKNLCFYRGAERARLMIVGEAPGRDEDLEGKPFVGRAGMLLDKMLAAIGLSEADVHITNIVYWRPPGNRTPTPQEARARQMARHRDRRAHDTRDGHIAPRLPLAHARRQGHGLARSAGDQRSSQTRAMRPWQSSTKTTTSSRCVSRC
jgi:DNA polymerase